MKDKTANTWGFVGFISYCVLVVYASHLAEVNRQEAADEEVKAIMISMVDRHIELIEQEKLNNYPEECKEDLRICDQANWMLIQEHNRMSDKVSQALKVVEMLERDGPK